MKKTVLISIMLILVFSLMSCSSDENKKIYGKYKFEKILYVSPLCSLRGKYLFNRLTGTKYIVRKDTFKINSPENQIKISNPIYKYEVMDDNLIQAFNDAVQNDISISKYKEKNQCSIYEKENQKPIYYLFFLDDEIWITSYMRTDYIEHILRLK